MPIHFLFSAHPLRPKVVEPMFADQFHALGEAGFSSSVVADDVLQGDKPLRSIPPGAEVVYRGWMLNGEQYARLSDAILAAGGVPFTFPQQYLVAHHLPNWYPLIAEFTPETKIFPAAADLASELRALQWDGYFVKDYVKSLKTTQGSIIRSADDITALIAEMQRVRGEIEGGICIRRVEDFRHVRERRYFVIKGKCFSADESAIPEEVEIVSRRIPSPFFSIDAIRRRDGVLRIVEVGDGQVSDLVGWSDERFAAVWKLGSGKSAEIADTKG